MNISMFPQQDFLLAENENTRNSSLLSKNNSFVAQLERKATKFLPILFLILKKKDTFLMTN